MVAEVERFPGRTRRREVAAGAEVSHSAPIPSEAVVVVAAAAAEQFPDRTRRREGAGAEVSHSAPIPSEAAAAVVVVVVVAAAEQFPDRTRRREGAGEARDSPLEERQSTRSTQVGRQRAR